MERTAPHVTRWPAKILGFSDRDMPDAAHGVLGLRYGRRRDLWAPSPRSWTGIGRHALW